MPIPPGTLLTIAPAAMELPMLLRVAMDAEQIGVTRLHLPDDIDDPTRVVAALRDQTGLIITAKAGTRSADDIDLVGHRGDRDTLGWTPISYGRPGAPDTHLIELAVAELPEPAELSTLTVNIGRRIANDHPVPVSLACQTESGLLAGLAALAAGGHICVGTQMTGGEPRQNVALAAKAGGIARLAGRPALSGSVARKLLGLA